MPRRASGRKLLKHQPFAFSPFLRSLALASTSRRKLPHPKDSHDMSFGEYLNFRLRISIQRRNRNQRRPRRGEEDICFSKAEDEFFLKLSSWSFTFPIRSQLVMGHDQPMGLVMAVEADKIPEFRQMLHSLLDE